MFHNAVTTFVITMSDYKSNSSIKDNLRDKVSFLPFKRNFLFHVFRKRKHQKVCQLLCVTECPFVCKKIHERFCTIIYGKMF